jgi:hypothetical protein
MTLRNSRTYDNLLLLKDAGAVTADGAAQVGGQARVVDVGLGRFEAVAVVDTSALDMTTTDETYRVAIQGSVDSAFTTPVELGSGTVSVAGRREIHFGNEIGGTIYRYLRAYLDVGGTTPSINCTIYVGKN